jgi:SAM-dependent methyltransferase
MNVGAAFRPFFAAAVLSALPALAQQDVPYVQTDMAVVDSMLSLAAPRPGEKLYDLGCGDGRIVIRAAERYGVHGVGIDSNPMRIRESIENARKAGVDSAIEFHVKDIFDTDFHDADVVAMYLLQWVNLKLRPALLADLAPGARIVSHAWSMGDWQPDRRLKVERRDGRGESYVLFWVVPANISGEWRWTLADATDSREHVLRVSQSFQHAAASLIVNGNEAACNSMAIDGERVRFIAREGGAVTVYEGIALGHAIEGTAVVAGDTLRWMARRNPKTLVPLDAGGPRKLTY